MNAPLHLKLYLYCIYLKIRFSCLLTHGIKMKYIPLLVTHKRDGGGSYNMNYLIKRRYSLIHNRSSVFRGQLCNVRGGGKNTAAGALFCINGKSNLYKQPFSNHLPNTFPSSLSILFVNPRGPLSKFFKYSCNKESEILQKSTKSVILY